MRLSSFHIDGFGALNDFGLDEMAPGLVVLLGPNEAGKSTLFDFLAGVLFGFPTRRDNPRFHAPVRGGRHGGRVSFLDEAGGTWTVERYAGTQRSLRVRLPDGSEGDERSLTRALAGASSSLFRAVFAVGLDDLGQMDNLESDEVRELLFAASIFGQRHSATKAMKHLLDARDDLARPRRDDAVANRLGRELEGVRSDLLAARHESAGYEQLQHQAERIDGEVRAIRSGLLELRNRERELQLLERCWHPYRKGNAARGELATLPEAGLASALLERGPEVRSLATGHSGHLERVEKLAELHLSAERLNESIEGALSSLGTGWTRERARSIVAPQLLADTARATFARLGELRTDLASADAVLAQVEALLATSEAAQHAGDIVPGGQVPTCSELEQRAEALDELKQRLAEVEHWELERLAEERDAKTDVPVTTTPERSTRLAAIALAAAGVVVAGLGAALLGHGLLAIASVTVLLGIVLVVCGGLLLVALSRRSASSRAGKTAETGDTGEAGEASRQAAAGRAALLDRGRARVDALAGTLGLDTPASRVDVERCAAALQRQRDERRKLDDRAAARSEAEDRVAGARDARELALGALGAEQQAHEAWCARHGLAAGGEHETLEAVAALIDIHGKLDALDRVSKATAEIEPSVRAFARRCQELLDSIGAEGVANAASERAADDADALGAQVTRQLRRLDDAVAVEARRAELQRDAAVAAAELEDALGAGDDGNRLRRELATGSLLKWATEREELQPSIEDLQRAEEAAVRQHQSTAEAMAQIAGSDRIAELEQREAELTVELDGVLHEYLVLGTARSLLQRTLARHERERQPAVIAKAAAHFQRVSGGRYVGLWADAGFDGKQAIRVVSTKGEPIDAASLSRGTIEQLYLCLRLGLADCFAERSVSLPVVLDDVLVNFDPERARAVATELAASARTHQIVFMTCHPHLAELALRASSEGPTRSQLIELGRVA
jgi:uncharacterized protein YhaN